MRYLYDNSISGANCKYLRATFEPGTQGVLQAEADNTVDLVANQQWPLCSP